MESTPANYVDILKVRFPRLVRQEALALLLDRFEREVTTGVCFPDMSAMVISLDDPGFRTLLQERMMVLNDGAGLAWVARRRGRPFVDNLNGTDLCPLFLEALPAGTGVFLVGGESAMVERARTAMEASFPDIRFVGTHHGFFDDDEEERLIEELRRLRPRVVIVGMGNPQQVRFIDRHLDDPTLAGTIFLAVGGLMNYYAGYLRRAPAWVRRVSLEWIYIVLQQPRKARRYFGGIPRFLFRSLLADIRNEHDAPDRAPQ